MFGFWGVPFVLGGVREAPLKGTLLNPTCVSLKRDLIPNSYFGV